MNGCIRSFFSINFTYIRSLACNKCASSFLKQNAGLFPSVYSRNISYAQYVDDCHLFGPEHRALQSTLGKIIEKDINPYVDQWETEQQFDAHTVFKKLGNAGLLGITRPTKYGGLGLDFSYNLAFIEELGSINCGGIPMGIMVHSNMTTPALLNFGSEELKEEFLVPSITGDKVSCLGISEPDCGSDVASIKTKAVRKGDDLIINGSKMWITNGCQADWMCLLANTREGKFHKNKSLICLPMNLPGVHVSKKIKKMGMHSSDTALIYFEDVRVPAKNIIGEEGQGFLYQMLQFQDERLCGAIISIPSMLRAIAETIEYCKQRRAFGKPIIENQIIHFRLAELQTEVEAYRSLVYRAVEAKMKEEDVTFLVSMAKLKGARLNREVMDTCLQFWGGMGYTDDVLISRCFRDSRLGSIGGGTDEIMTSIICRYMGILPK